MQPVLCRSPIALRLTANLQLTMALPKCGACSAVVPKSFDRYRLKKQQQHSTCASVTPLGMMYESFLNDRKLVQKQGSPELVCRCCRDGIQRIHRLKNQVETLSCELQKKLEKTWLQQSVTHEVGSEMVGLKRGLSVQSPQSCTGLTPAAKKKILSPVPSTHLPLDGHIPLRQRMLRPKPRELFSSSPSVPAATRRPHNGMFLSPQ